jgi:hypothetical protein
VLQVELPKVTGEDEGEGAEVKDGPVDLFKKFKGYY